MSEGRPTLYLVDGSGYIFRAFFALPQLNNSRGLPTNAIYGFTRMIVKLLKDARPSHLGIIFDSPRKTFRDDLFEDYKANRVTPPNDLVVQIPFIHRMVETFRTKSVMIDGYEADDVIGTLAIKAARRKFNTIIVTADKDFMQLVSPNITLWDTMRDKRIGVREVRDRFGVEPRALVEVMALMGDPIDNIKGVPGVGEKTAISLIKKFGSLDHLFVHLDELEQASDVRGAKKIAGLIAQHRGDVELARKLVRIDTDVPLPLEADDFVFRGVDQKQVAELMRELEFGSLLRELTPSEGKIASLAAAEIAVELDGLAAMIADAKAASRIYLHLTGDGAEFLKLQAEGQDRVYSVASALIPELRRLLEAGTPAKACHDLKTHLRRLAARQIGLGGVEFDTMLAGFLVNPGRAEPSLEDLFHEHVAPLGGKMDGSEPQIVAALRRALAAKLEEDGLTALFSEIELPLAYVLAAMEQTGVSIDAKVLEQMSTDFDQQLRRLERECYEVAGKEFNLNSPIQLRDVFFKHLKLPTKGLKKTKSGYSTDVDALTKLAALHPLPQKLLEYRTLAKLKSTYIDSLPTLIDPSTRRLHTSFHQALTATGRLSSSEPNLQNIPTRTEEGHRIRRAFVADPGWLLLSADYSQIELRVLAQLSRDATLIEAFRRGEDIHTRTACEVLGITPQAVDADARRLAKIINFGIIYGMGPQRLAGELGIPLNEAAKYIERYFERLSGVRAYCERSLAQARERGFVITMFGRRRYLPELNSPQGGARSQAERIAINTPIQGTAADLIKIAMVRLHRLLRPEIARMLLQVHDELLLEVDRRSLEEVAGMTKETMEGVANLEVPLQVELKSGPNWAELRG